MYEDTLGTLNPLNHDLVQNVGVPVQRMFDCSPDYGSSEGLSATYLLMSLLVRSRRVRELSKVISSGRLRILLSLSSRTEMAVREDNSSGSNCSIWLFPKYKSCTQSNRNR